VVSPQRPIAPTETAEPGDDPSARRVSLLLPPLVAAGGGLALALSALLPGVAFWDTGEFQTVAPVLGTAHSPGYPTYVILGWLANILLTPFGEPAFRMNLFSGLCLAAGAALTSVVVRQLTGRSAIGVATGLGLAASPLAWRVGTHAEPHALHLALIALLLVLLVGWDVARRRPSPHADRWLIAAAASFGLAAGNHSLTLLLAPAIGIYVLAVEPSILRRPGLIATCLAALFGVLVLVYLELPLRAGPFRAPLVYGRPDTWEGFWYIALAQQFQGAISNPFEDLPRKAGDLAALAEHELGVLVLLLPAAAIVTIRRFPRFALLTGLSTLITVLFAASYANADIARYYLGPLLMAWTWLAILVATTVDALAALAALPARAVASRGLAVGLAALLVLPAGLAVPAVHGSVDERRDDGARVWLEAALDQIAQNAVVVSWWSYSTPLWYAQLVEGRRPDIFIVDDRTMLDLRLGEATDVIARYVGRRPVYVIRANQHDLGLVLARFELRQGSGAASNLFEVLGPARAAS
jgi:hypothetical protein